MQGARTTGSKLAPGHPQGPTPAHPGAPCLPFFCSVRTHMSVRNFETARRKHSHATSSRNGYVYIGSGCAALPTIIRPESYPEDSFPAGKKIQALTRGLQYVYASGYVVRFCKKTKFVKRHNMKRERFETSGKLKIHGGWTGDSKTSNTKKWRALTASNLCYVGCGQQNKHGLTAADFVYGAALALDASRENQEGGDA